MTDRAQGSAFRRFLGSRLFLVVLLLIAVFIALSFARAYYTDYTVRQEISRLEREIDQLETKKIESLEILDYVATDTFVEDTARTELNLKRPGEHVVIVQDLDLGSQGDETTEKDIQGLNNPAKWWYYFTRKHTQ